jgi:acyl-CoA synthetase (AMP-forming)/AMP-acid ligase II
MHGSGDRHGGAVSDDRGQGRHRRNGASRQAHGRTGWPRSLPRDHRRDRGRLVGGTRNRGAHHRSDLVLEWLDRTAEAGLHQPCHRLGASGVLRRSITGPHPAPPDLIRQAVQMLPGVALSNTFGQTETLGAYAALSPDDHRGGHKLDSVARSFPGVELRVVDVDTQEDVGVGQVGEAVVRAARNITSDWMPTEDLVVVDDEGYIFVKGRMKDTINRGGEKFGPVEIETAIRTLPGVREVAVAGVPDEELGERVGALIVAEGTLTGQQVIAHCEELLARFKQPEIIVFVDELPFNPLRKIPRSAEVEAIRANVG